MSDGNPNPAAQPATDLVIVGAGAAGLMAAAVAGEMRIRVLLLERRHRPGLKLLLCGNNRCNITHASATDEMLRAYGPPVQQFLSSSIHKLSPRDLVNWFGHRGLPTTVHPDGRVFPKSENADDVLHCFTDLLRSARVPLALNSPVKSVTREKNAFRITTDAFSVTARAVLLATGGVSYPKTGSVGDGQRFARQLGHRVTPFRPGLAGIEFEEPWLHPSEDISIPSTRVKLIVKGNVEGETEGEILFSRQCARGPAMVDASRMIARRQLHNVSFLIDLCPQQDEPELAETLRKIPARSAKTLEDALTEKRLVPPTFVRHFLNRIPKDTSHEQQACRLAHRIKNWKLKPSGIRSLKEAMVTVGGVYLDEIDPKTMQSRICPGLYFAGEIMDVDGPTGGYNLHAAFATAQCAVEAIAACFGATVPIPQSPLRKPRRRKRPRRQRKPGPQQP